MDDNNNNIISDLNSSQMDSNTNSDAYNIDVSKLNLDSNGEVKSNDSASNVPDENIQANTNKAPEQIEIDPRYSNLPREEALIRTLQSRYDKTQAELQKVLKDYELSAKIKDTFEKMVEDENLLRIFVNQVKPGLIPKKDYGEIIKEKLKQEFGEDYKPQLTRLEAERDDPGGTDWKYYKKLDQLERELMGSEDSEANSIKEYIENMQKKKLAEQKELELEVEKIKKEMNASEDEIKGVLNWAEKLKLKDILTLHRFLRKFHRVPDIQSPSNQSSNISSPDREKFLKEIFGN
mgnify:FL=1